jgi:hypothetical protein
MKIVVVNFGFYTDPTTLELKTQTLANGKGKTTLLNAYVFALSGKTLNGFVPENVNMQDGEQTEVTLHHFLSLPPIRRVRNVDGGTTLYVGSDVATQTDFNQYLRSVGYDMDFIIACANANVLTSNGLDAETLRKILSKADVLDSEEYDALKKKQKDLRAKRKSAETYALTNVVIPIHATEPLNDSESTFVKNYIDAQRIVEIGLRLDCPCCGVTYSVGKVLELTKRYENAKLATSELGDVFKDYMERSSMYAIEQEDIDYAQRLVNLSENARKDLIRLDKEINEVTLQLSQIDTENVRANLPEGVTIVTEVKQKNGVVKPTCTLELNGVPLKSINHAKRIEICVNILAQARANKNMFNVPIIIDNAEAVSHNFEYYQNVILLSAKKY